jgi:thymidylate synthase ThyX
MDKLKIAVWSLLERFFLKILRHVTVPLSHGGKVVVLNTGSIIGPEAVAMLQALHSRSVGGIIEHLQTLAKKGASKFISLFYVGYGHKSIGDCGTTTIFIEGVSMLAAKSIQDWPLYSGQESSTRYIDFAKQRFVDPAGFIDSDRILEKWRAFYLHGLEVIQRALVNRYPKKESDKVSVYEKAIKARSFDIMRGFLPAGASTNLAWHSNLRQIADKLLVLRHHPLPEIKEIAEAIEDAVSEAFPSSFDKEKRYEETEEYNRSWMRENYYYHDPNCQSFVIRSDNIDRGILQEYEPVMKSRPPKTELPKHIAEAGTMQFVFPLDFGSFRDIQRHRAVFQRMPLVTAELGFEEWYLNELTDELKEDAVKLIEEQKKSVEQLCIRKEIEQYYHPMGYKLSNRMTGNLHALVYLVELRATRFVHPTARHIAIQIAKVLQYRFEEYGLVLHLDKEPGMFDVKRGEHDIVSKETA